MSLVFISDEADPIIEKIIALLIEKKEIEVKEFNDAIIKLRNTKDDAKEVEDYLKKQGIIRRIDGGKKIILISS